MNNLSLYGWNESLLQLKQKSIYKNFEHGRVLLVNKTCYEVISEQGIYVCELTGNMMYGRAAVDYPCTGDWVIFQPVDSDKGIIYDLLTRIKTLYRLKSGTVTQKQALAAYVDKAFIVQCVDNRFNVRRIERFLMQLSAENIQPAIVITKIDLDYEQTEVELALKHLSDKIPVFFTSIHQPESIKPLRDSIKEGESVVFVGLSGAGKSSLINVLCGKSVMQTASVSSSTGKGRHTTTRREMMRMDNSGILIDTPGIKLLGITNEDEEALSDMLNISDFEDQCFFSDCRHINEKGCAVMEAVQKGLIEKSVYASYLKLIKEAWHYSASVYEKRKREKSLSKLLNEFKKSGYKKR
jgi:ribosome biogenesis GTPase / thiamine phosphate phosphatase